MANLTDHQNIFYENCFGNSSNYGAKLIIPFGISGEDRLNIYKNNTFITLTEALSATYSTIEQLVGEDFFAFMTREYIKLYPPKPGPLFEYGSSYSNFIQNFKPAPSIPYLADIASLEWVMNEAHHAADAFPICAKDLLNISEEQLVKMTFTVHPSCNILSSKFPIDMIWKANNDTGSFNDIDIAQSAQLIVLRPNDTVIIQSIDRAVYEFLTNIKNGSNVDQAVLKTITITPDFDAAKTLIELISLGVFTNFNIHNSPPNT